MPRKHLEESEIGHIENKSLVVHLKHSEKRLSQNTHWYSFMALEYSSEALQAVLPDILIFNIFNQRKYQQLVYNWSLVISA